MNAFVRAITVATTTVPVEQGLVVRDDVPYIDCTVVSDWRRVYPQDGGVVISFDTYKPIRACDVIDGDPESLEICKPDTSMGETYTSVDSVLIPLLLVAVAFMPHAIITLSL